MKTNQSGQLFCIALPIGNELDLSERAKSALSVVDFIAAEDTRVFKDFCRATKISYRGKVVAYHDVDEAQRADGILKLLLEGKSVALVSDAGTPNISDPGYRILSLAFENNLDVIPVPGPSSVMAALSICPLPGVHFCFMGFPPSKSSQRMIFLKDLNFDGRIVMFESPHRIKEHIDDALAIWGPDQRLFICRELTKKFEEKNLRTLAEWSAHFSKTTPKGEFVLIYEGKQPKANELDLDQWLQQQINSGISSREILEDAQKRFKIGRKVIYNKIMKLKNNPSEE